MEWISAPRELSVDNDGIVAPADANGPAIPAWGWENIGFETPAPRAWIEVDEIPAHADEDEDCDGEVDEDGDCDDADGERRFWKRQPLVNARLRVLARHELVRSYGFAPSQLVDGEDRALGFEVLAVATEACRAARTLGRREACRVLEVEDKGQSLSSIGVNVLFKRAADLQAATARPAPAPKRSGIAPRASIVAPAPAPAPAPAATRCAALAERIEAGKQTAVRLKSPGAVALLERALVYRSQYRAEELVEQAERMLVACEAAAAHHPAHPTHSGNPRAGAPGGVRRPGKTARDRAK